jgi:hypothetical protein
MKRIPLDMDEILKHSLPSASWNQVESASARVLRRLQSNAVDSLPDVVIDTGPARSFGWQWYATAAVAASLVILSIWIGVGSRNHGVFAVPAEGLLYRGAEGSTDYYRAGDRIKPGETIHTNGEASAAFTLPDGSRVEMRSNSELSLEDVNDGARIRLNKGALMVDAASKPSGSRLYVQTDNVTASALAAGFLINVERSGTRVGAIWGVIRVEQGDRVTTLQPGEQTTSTPLMSSVSLVEEIEWSRNANTYQDKLKQVAGTAPAAPPQAESEHVESPELPQLSIRRQPYAVVDGARPSPPAFVDPWAEGKRILDRSCSGCHSTEFVYQQILNGRTQQRYSNRSAYEELISAENARGAGVSESEFAPLVDWLSNFSGFK